MGGWRPALAGCAVMGRALATWGRCWWVGTRWSCASSKVPRPRSGSRLSEPRFPSSESWNRTALRGRGSSRHPRGGGVDEHRVARQERVVTEIAGMSRREFLVAANAAAFLLFLESCSIGSLGRQAPSPSIPRGASAYEQALKLLRDAVRASPDHLAQRAAEVVATRDATKIVDFVRQRIAVLPPFVEYDDPATARRWGSAATLRGGQGTLRDRADLLAELLSQAGFKAQVQVAERPSTIALDGLYASRAVAFAPDRGRIDLARQVLRQGGFPAPGSQHAFAPGPDPAAAILAALPSEIQVARVRNDLLPQRVPVVAFEDGAKQRYAYAIEGAGIVDAAPSKLVSRDADAVRTITITVSAMCNPALGGSTPRGRIVDLVTASWPADQVVARQALLAFIPPPRPKPLLPPAP